MHTYAKYLGDTVRLELKNGDQYYLRVMSVSESRLNGFDEERLNISIKKNDIAQIQRVK